MIFDEGPEWASANQTRGAEFLFKNSDGNYPHRTAGLPFCLKYSSRIRFNSSSREAIA